MVTPDASVLAGLRLTAGLPLPLQQRLAAAMTPVHLHGGDWLFRQDDAGHTLYLLRSGRLEILRTVHGEERLLAVLQPGDVVGELALLEGGRRSAGARALRDCDLLALDRADVAPLLGDPDFAAALLRGVSRMLRADPPPQDDASRRHVVSVLGTDGPAISRLVDDIRAELLAGGVSVATMSSAGGVGPLDELERDHEAVLLDAGVLGSPWAGVCARQADRVLLLVRPGTSPPPRGPLGLGDVELVVLGDMPAPVAWLDAWWAAVSPRAHHRVRDRHRAADIGRLARRLTGRSLGLVLSGGGARAMAHIGVLRALEEAGIVVDRFAGASMGAFVAALAATGRRSSDIWDVVARELVPRHPFRDYTFPRVALIRGHRAEQMLQRTFGGTDARQLPRSWFAVSASLGRAELRVHQRGPVWEATACSMSLPGLAPPRRWNGELVVDGGVLDNLPVRTMCRQHEGQVIASDVTLRRVLAADDEGLPGIVDTLASTMVLASWRERQDAHAAARLVISPDVGDLSLLEFDQAEAAVRAGHAATVDALRDAGDLLHPVPEE